MRVAMYYNNRDVRLEEMPTPAPGRGEMLLKTMASGICGSDVMEWYRIRKAPLVLGHEVTGVVAEADPGVDRFQQGDRVFVAHHVPCNTCRYCLNGDHTSCDTLHTTNFDPGGFAEYIRIPALHVDRGTFRLPEEVSFEDGTFIEPLACVVRAQRAVGVRPGQHLLILGSGLSGLLHLLLARASGAARIVLTDVNAERLRMAESLGADEALPASEDVPRRLCEGSGGRLADHVIVCTSALPAFHQALASVDRAGTLLFFAPTDPGVALPVPVQAFWRNNIRLVHSYGSSPADTAVAIELLRSGTVSVGPMITHRFDLADAQEGFRLVAESAASIKVILEPHRFAS